MWHVFVSQWAPSVVHGASALDAACRRTAVICANMADETAKAQVAQAGGDTIFGKIVRKEIPASLIHEDEQVRIVHVFLVRIHTHADVKLTTADVRLTSATLVLCACGYLLLGCNARAAVLQFLVSVLHADPATFAPTWSLRVFAPPPHCTTSVKRR